MHLLIGLGTALGCATLRAGSALAAAAAFLDGAAFLGAGAFLGEADLLFGGPAAKVGKVGDKAQAAAVRRIEKMEEVLVFMVVSVRFGIVADRAGVRPARAEKSDARA
jgi:hypothetical protein